MPAVLFMLDSDFRPCFTLNVSKLEPDFVLKRFCTRINYISLIEGDIFAQTAPIPQWHALDQTLNTHKKILWLALPGEIHFKFFS